MASNSQRQGRKSRMQEKMQWLMPLQFSKQRAWADPDDHGIGVLHGQRLQFVQAHLQRSPQSHRRIGDLGCGAGALMQRLLDLPDTGFVLGLDVSAEALVRARQHPGIAHAVAGGRLQMQVGSFMQVDLQPWRLDTLVLLEVIEHLPPQRLEALERQLFRLSDACHILISTPNADYNPVLGLSAGARRHPDHRFEWGRQRFLAWATGVGRRHGFAVAVEGIGSEHEAVGAPTQIAVFTR